MPNFGDRLKCLRKEKSLNQEDLGLKFKLAKSTISQYELSKRSPDPEILAKFADFFNVTVDYLLGRTNVRIQYDNKDKVSDAIEDDPELRAFWDELKDRESLQLMFKQVKNMDDKSIKQVIKIIKAIEDEESNE